MTIRPDQLYALERDARRLLVAVVTMRDRGTGADEVHDAAAALRQVLPTVRPQGEAGAPHDVRTPGTTSRGLTGGAST